MRFLIITVLCILLACQKPPITYLQVPGWNEYCKIDEKGTTVLPSGRTLTPAGDLIRITHDPFGLALSPDGRTAVSLHNGVFTIIAIESLSQVRIPSYDQSISSPLSHGSFLGVDFSADNQAVYLSGGDNGSVIVYDIINKIKIDSISLDGSFEGVDYEDSFTSDLIRNGEELLILDRGNFRMVRYDLQHKKITASIPVGRQPFGLSISADKKMAFVANVGMYAYPDNSPESIEGTVVEGKNIPGVGSPLAAEAMSVFSIDLNTNQVIDKYKTGYQIGEMVEDAEVVGGASPNSIAIGTQYIYVTNATNANNDGSEK